MFGYKEMERKKEKGKKEITFPSFGPMEEGNEMEGRELDGETPPHFKQNKSVQHWKILDEYTSIFSSLPFFSFPKSYTNI